MCLFAATLEILRFLVTLKFGQGHCQGQGQGQWKKGIGPVHHLSNYQTPPFNILLVMRI